ncbi:hypothetical protein [Clostridium saccharoperbutylacetonicum]|uniref:hypothetical protein n=1 Tax=Clostridium saccharoperbutylacetonicum TaxID=36745 RepID=UPI0039EAAA2F
MKSIIERLKNMSGEEFHSWIIVGVKLLVGLCVLIILTELLKAILNFYNDFKIRKKMVVLKVLPKKSIDLKETENIIKNLHEMLINTKIRKYIYGRQYMSFEVGATQGKINFYIAVPADIKDRIVDRIYSSYSEVAIEITEEYIPNIKEHKLSVYSAELKLGYHHVLKLKTQDILGSLLSAMLDLDSKDFVGFQILIRPIDSNWQRKGRNELNKFDIKGIRPGQKKNFGDHVANILVSVENELLSRGRRTVIDINQGLRKNKLDRREVVGVSEKVIQVGFETSIRLVALGKFKKSNTTRIKALVAAFAEINGENKLKRSLVASHMYIFNRYRKRMMQIDNKDYNNKGNILVPSELSSFTLRLPGEQLLEKYNEIERLAIKEFKAPEEAVVTGKGVLLGLNKYRAMERYVELKYEDFKRHLVVQGKTGTGKSEWLKTVFIDHISDKYDENGKLIRKGKGAMLLEPHGKLSDEMMELIPENRWKDTIIFDLFSDHPLGFNFCKVPERESDKFTQEQLAQKTLDEAIEIFKRAFEDVWSEKNEFYIENAVRAIMDAGKTMLELPRMFTDEEFRNSIIPLIKDKKVKDFWIKKFKKNAKGQIDASVDSTAQSVEYKLDKFLRSKELQRALGQDECIDFKDIIDNNKIIIFKFSKDKMSADKINFIGGIAIKLMIVAAFSRDKLMWDDLFLLAVDEAQNFISESIKDILYELRKYGLGLLLMHQELKQMKKVPGLIDAIYNNVGSKITFTTGSLDASFFTKEYSPRVDVDDLMNLPFRNGYCKLLIDGTTSDTFNLYSIDSPKVTTEEATRAVEEIKKLNAEGRMSVEEIDMMIAERYEEFDDELDLDAGEFSIEVDEAEEFNDIESDDKVIELEIEERVEDQENENDIEEKKVSSYWEL